MYPVHIPHLQLWNQNLLWSSLAKVYFRNKLKRISATDWPRSIHSRAAGEYVTPIRRSLPRVTQHIFILALQQQKKWRLSTKYRSDLMFHPWKCLWTCPRNGCWVLTKRTLMTIVNWSCGSFGWSTPLILKLVYKPPCHLKGWELSSLLECGKLKTELTDLVCLIPRSPGNTTYFRTTEPAKIFFSLDGLPSPAVLIMNSLWSSCTFKGQWREQRSKNPNRSPRCPQHNLKQEKWIPKSEVIWGPKLKGGKISP